ncbi:hypothetical protein F4811DRAFT_536175, partial [Daldinia bambusicola]
MVVVVVVMVVFSLTSSTPLPEPRSSNQPPSACTPRPPCTRKTRRSPRTRAALPPRRTYPLPLVKDPRLRASTSFVPPSASSPRLPVPVVPPSTSGTRWCAWARVRRAFRSTATSTATATTTRTARLRLLATPATPSESTVWRMLVASSLLPRTAWKQQSMASRTSWSMLGMATLIVTLPLSALLPRRALLLERSRKRLVTLS